MSGILNSFYGTLGKTSIIVTEMNKTVSTTSGTTIASAGFNRVPGRIYIVMLAWDPSGAAVPTVTSVMPLPSGPVFTALTPQLTAPATTSAGTGVIMQAFLYQQTTAFSTGVQATFSAAIANKAMTIIEVIGATTTQRNTATTSIGTTSAPNYASPSGNAKDLILTMIGQEVNIAGQPTSGSTSTTGGTWSTISNNFTTGGNAASNIGISYQYKILNAAGTQTNTWTMGSTNNWGSQSFAIASA